jgi:acetyltransferase-like isoleucine patch superfamily enzyme
MPSSDAGQYELLEQIREVHRALAEEMQARWRRDLPLPDLIGDRWERAGRLGFGEGTSIYDSSHIFGDVRVGSNTWIGPFTILDGSGGLEIGDYCSISAGVQIYSHDTVDWAVSGGALRYEYAAVRIGSRCYIGAQTVIARGVTIGEGSIIGACSFVHADVPPGSIAVGAPARVVGSSEFDGHAVVRRYESPGS